MPVVVATGCGSLRKTIDNINDSAASYHDLQDFIQQELVTKFHRSVRSVSCTPHVQQVLPGDSVTLSCLVRFTDGTSYTTPGTITDPSTDPDIATESFSFTDPPAIDITTAPLPAPSVKLAATSPSSLFLARNLTPVVRKLTTRLGSHDLIVQLALYPGALEAVVASNGTAWPVTATYSGALTVGSSATFDGSRNGIDFSQFVPSVIEELTDAIAAKGGVPRSRIARFVLVSSLPGGNAGWNVYLTSGGTRFQALVLGQHLEMITESGTRPLN